MKPKFVLQGLFLKFITHAYIPYNACLSTNHADIFRFRRTCPALLVIGASDERIVGRLTGGEPDHLQYRRVTPWAWPQLQNITDLVTHSCAKSWQVCVASCECEANHLNLSLSIKARWWWIRTFMQTWSDFIVEKRWCTCKRRGENFAVQTHLDQIILFPVFFLYIIL